MRLTTRSKFAVTAMLDIALHSQNGSKPVTLADVSIRHGMSLSYLEQLFVKLRKLGLVKSYKGPGGGYVVHRNLDELNILDIISAVDDDMDARTCQGSENCHDNRKCITHDLWQDLTQKISSYLSSITLNDLISKASNEVVEKKIIFCKK